MDKLKKVLSLVKKTSDKCIITDIDNDEIFVVMTLDDYEGLVNRSVSKVAKPSQLGNVVEKVVEKKEIITEKPVITETKPVNNANNSEETNKSDSDSDLLAKINRDVANWKAANGEI